MKYVALSVYLVLLPLVADAQTAISEPSELLPKVSLAMGIHDYVQLSEAQLYQSSTKRGMRCCSKKGAIVGASIGAGLGFLMVAIACDGTCTADYIKACGVFGAIGAALGASIHPSHSTPLSLPRRPGATFLPIVSSETRGGLVLIRF